MNELFLDARFRARLDHIFKKEIGLKWMGEKISAISATQRRLIAEKMAGIVYASSKIDPEKWIKVSRPMVVDDRATLFVRRAKEVFAERAEGLFDDAMSNDFRHGEMSKIVQGNEHEYSHKDILAFALQNGSTDLGKAIGEDLTDDYRIRLCLDREQTEKKEQLVFIVTEVNAEKELSTESFTIRKLEQEDIAFIKHKKCSYNNFNF